MLTLTFSNSSLYIILSFYHFRKICDCYQIEHKIILHKDITFKPAYKINPLVSEPLSHTVSGIKFTLALTERKEITQLPLSSTERTN